MWFARRLAQRAQLPSLIAKIALRSQQLPDHPDGSTSTDIFRKVSAYEREGTPVIDASSKHVDTVSLRVDDEGIAFDGKLALAREQIASVSLGLEQRTTVIVRPKKGAPLKFPFTSADDANGLIAALGRPRDGAVLEVALEASVLRPGFHPLAWWWAIVLLPLVVAVAFFAGGVRVTPAIGGTGRRLTMGADGLRLTWFLLDEFLPWSAIASVTTRGDVVVLRLQDGRESTFTPEVVARVPDIVARIAASIENARSAAPLDEHVAGLLGSDVTALREIGSEHDAAYRAAHVPRERLLSLVEDPAAPPVTRARAAVALSANASTEEKQRLRIAADASVSPKVRIAIDAAAAEDDDESLAQKLADVEKAR